MTTSKKIVASDARTNVEMMLNLNGTDKPITKAFSFLKHTDDTAPYILNPTTYNNVISMKIADSNGNDHVFSTYFAKTAKANEWNAYVFIDGRNIDTVKHDVIVDEARFFPTGELIDQSDQLTPISTSYLSSIVLDEGELTANPLKISFDSKGQLVNVADVNALLGFRMQEPTAEQLKEYTVTHEPILATFVPLTTANVYFDHVDLSTINPTFKSDTLNISIDFTNSTQFATPFVVNDLKQTWQLNGTSENDTIVGSAGNDRIIGYMGTDKMTGGLGADKFTFYNAEESGLTAKTRDIITDFKHSEGDKIDVSLLLTDSATHDFSFIGSKAFSKTDATGQLRFDTATHILYGSINADNKPEFSIQLNGVKSLVVDDFIGNVF